MTTSSWAIDQLVVDPRPARDRGREEERWPLPLTALFVVVSSCGLWAMIIALASLVLG